MTKSELIERLVQRQAHMSHRDVELAVKLLLDDVITELASGGRVEIRGFGSFSVHHRPARRGRNPKTGEAVDIPRKYVPHFKPGKELRERVNTSHS
ncbi:integration host factor subunit beta [Endozoicomonas sp. G2_2]|uniref:integration host factor subunit beta n=1 Tax=Endozoicomonas sp. G2_2 TaxID=2821092 RepID=UPI001ADAE970|nr:integration host factor subunit beta [Endozoicomonas sp. G2_2]MBO9470184.1 integration host factor subunit beta [Endozoicomonas sp. G2_2]|tara:strand:+ start:534 stop:821 length:288 start_codon:yes stop_codon:yes gene_type:complete